MAKRVEDFAPKLLPCAWRRVFSGHHVAKLAQRGSPIGPEYPSMKRLFELIFTWWNRDTFGTQLWTWLYGEFVGEDEFGNRYYRTRRGKIDRTLNMERRWVSYNGYAEPSTVPPAWHGWLHHTVNTPPTSEDYKPRAWQKPHRSNMTGTPGALRPTGSTLALGRRPRATGDYKPWTPGR
jgi:NADH:ubiquinone oxidoreductase subunit